MTRSRPIVFLASAAAIPLAALTIAACGGGGSAATAAAPNTVKSGTVDVAKTSLGSILVNSSGRTLYLFKADSGSKSACSGSCAAAWPPLLTNGKPTAGTGVTGSKLGTITRAGGKRQVTYSGHPLYLFIQDQKSGDVTGQGSTAFGAPWYVLSPAGQQITNKPTSSSTGSSSGGGGASIY